MVMMTMMVNVGTKRNETKRTKTEHSHFRVGTMFSTNPELEEDSDGESKGGEEGRDSSSSGTNDLIVRQAEGARVGGRMLCALDRCVCTCLCATEIEEIVM